MNYNECAFEELVIDSLYAQRRQQFFKHGRSQSDSSRSQFIPSSASSPGRRDRSSSAIFSIFRWFRRESRSDDVDPEFAPSAPPSPQLIRNHSTSCGSVDTLFSTATANSFAFVHPAYYRPFGAANPPEKRILPGPETETYRNRLRQRDRIRELDRNLTLKKKYHLFSSGTLYRSVDDVNNRHLFLNKSLDSLKINNVSENSKNSTLGRKKRKAPPPPVSPEEKPKAVELPAASEQNKENSNGNSIPDSSPSNGIVVRRHRRTVSDSAKDRKSGAFVHVRGKRKAPPPPVVNNNKEDKSSGHEVLGTQSLGRKKRPAPPPPLVINRNEDENNTGSQGMLTPEEKQRLIDNITKLQAHADRKSLLVVTPPASPDMNTKVSHTVCNDSLKLERGVLKANKSEIRSPEAKPVTPTTPTPVSPRPWYKRNAGNKEKSLEKRKDKPNVEDWMPEVAIVRKNAINSETNSSSSTSSSSNGNSYRLSSIFSRFDKPEEKRKSQISMLANISELDREAAEIVQREQEKERAMLAAQDAKYYNNISADFVENNENDLGILHIDENVQKSPESPKKSGARELISLFNAIGNVTKVTVHSAFFSKDGPSIFSKEGVEKRFSMSGEGVKISEEKVIKESIIKSNGYKRETVFVETKESFSESPGIKRRRNSDDSGSSASSGAASPRVVIEEIDDTDKSKTQALYEANKIRKHHSPSPSIPTIAEMSESMTSSMTASPGSTINASERSVSVTPTPTASKPPESVGKRPTDTNAVSEPDRNVATPINKPNESASKVAVESGSKQPPKNYSIWSCPRCTLENPRWRVTCEACDMWRPAVRRDVIDKLTNANMGSMIAVNHIKAGEPKSTSAVKQLSSKVEPSTAVSPVPVDSKSQNSHSPSSGSAPKGPSVITSSSSLVEPAAAAASKISNAGQVGSKILQPQNPSVKNNLSLSNGAAAKSSILKPITVSGLLNGSCYEPKQSTITEIKDITDIEINGASSANTKETENIPVGQRASSSGRLQKEISAKQNLPGDNNLPVLQKSSKSTEVSPKTVESSGAEAASLTGAQSESDMEEVRKARLAFFEKSQVDNETDNHAGKEPSPSSSSISQAKIDALFSIASKGSLATNEEERLKVKEILKEMKNSLPKKSRPEVSIAGKENVSNAASSTSSADEAARLGAIKKSKAQTSQLLSSPKDISVRETDNKQQNKTAEVYLIKSETIIEEIKVKDSSKSPKVSTSVQTSGVVRKVEPDKTIVPTKNEEPAKSVTGKPPTPKSVRKEISVPVTVEEHVLTNNGVETTVSQETHKMGIGAFKLIRPRDFANIKATKTGSEVKPLHVYVNVPRARDDDSSSSSSSDGPEVSQLTAELTKPKGLADFKASVAEHGAGSKMDTLAVNRLLRQLEAAIAGGQHTRAATLARQLARHKVNCCVTRHRRATDTIPVDVFVEDRLSHQGPYPVQVSPSMTVAQLKACVEAQFEIPAAVQRWILGKQLATDDRSTLQQHGVTQPHCPVFLYLVAPDADSAKAVGPEAGRESEETAGAAQPASHTEGEGAVGAAPAHLGATPAQPGGRGWYFNQEEDRYSYCETEDSSKDASPEPTRESVLQPARAPVVEEPVVVAAEEEEEEEVEVEVEEEGEESEEEEEEKENTASGTASNNPPAAVVGTLTIGWKCSACTLINSPTRPGCGACGADRPADYRVPEGHEASGAEQRRLRDDQAAQQAAADEKLDNYLELQRLENADLIATTEPFECTVCLTECAASEGAVLRDCLHAFCRACLAQTVQHTEEAEVRCPYRDERYACDSTLQEREIKALVTPEVYEQHLAKSVAQAENKIGNTFHCKTPDCPGWCIFEDNVNTFQCPVCNQVNCLTCQAIHPGVDCKQHQERARLEAETNADARRTREMLEEMVQRGEALPCPTCHVVLMKKWGCDWLRCSMCKTEICWVTRGPRWGPGGKGDTSAGCKCGVNGVKCHPKCNYCH